MRCDQQQPAQGHAQGDVCNRIEDNVHKDSAEADLLYIYPAGHALATSWRIQAEVYTTIPLIAGDRIIGEPVAARPILRLQEGLVRFLERCADWQSEALSSRACLLFIFVELGPFCSCVARREGTGCGELERRGHVSLFGLKGVRKSALCLRRLWAGHAGSSRTSRLSSIFVDSKQ